MDILKWHWFNLTNCYIEPITGWYFSRCGERKERIQRKEDQDSLLPQTPVRGVGYLLSYLQCITVRGTLCVPRPWDMSGWFQSNTKVDRKEVLAVRLSFQVLLQVRLNLVEYFGYILALVQLRIQAGNFQTMSVFLSHRRNIYMLINLVPSFP